MLLIPCLVAPEESAVYNYNAKNFKQKIEQMDGNFIMFYAPWCRHCTDFQPIWYELAEMVNTPDSKFVIAQVDCTTYNKLCNENLAPTWAELGKDYAQNDSVQIGKINCMEYTTTCLNFDVKDYPQMLWIVNGKVMGKTIGEQTLEELNQFVEKMARPENHNPEKFLKKKKVLPVARISEDTFEMYMKKELVFINYFATWCAHCKQMVPIWLELGLKYQNNSHIIIADVDCSQSETLCVQENVSYV
ncbi:Thioredoxin domain-containing protein 5 [Eumeta japonica]|uniref:Thioredoxin domain-containing protein 5 n=1 Tax=Eumeta variegata TaxID=151549 RepID=A0A4C1W329_EUMVA|nr:Thioredoxin domain-containing protein 5 [Eumeta japonica]